MNFFCLYWSISQLSIQPLDSMTRRGLVLRFCNSISALYSMICVNPLAPLSLLWWYHLYTMNSEYALKLPRDPRRLSLGYVLTPRIILHVRERHSTIYARHGSGFNLNHRHWYPETYSGARTTIRCICLEGTRTKGFGRCIEFCTLSPNVNRGICSKVSVTRGVGQRSEDFGARSFACGTSWVGYRGCFAQSMSFAMFDHEHGLLRRCSIMGWIRCFGSRRGLCPQQQRTLSIFAVHLSSTSRS